MGMRWVFRRGVIADFFAFFFFACLEAQLSAAGDCLRSWGLVTAMVRAERVNFVGVIEW